MIIQRGVEGHLHPHTEDEDAPDATWLSRASSLVAQQTPSSDHVTSLFDVTCVFVFALCVFPLGGGQQLTAWRLISRR